LSHAAEWLLFPDNLGAYISIDETSLSNGELYTIITNREAHGGRGAIVAIVKGTKADDVIAVVEQIPEGALQTVQEVTLDLSESMRKIVPYQNRTPVGSHTRRNECQTRGQRAEEKVYTSHF